MLRITAYADRLLADLDQLDWSESIKLMQRNWIGRSTGALGALRRRGARRTRHRGVHHAARHALRRDLHGARAGAPAGRRDHGQRVARRRHRQRLVEQRARRVEGHLRRDRHAVRRGARYASSRGRSPSSSGRPRAARRPACSRARSRSTRPTARAIPIFIADYVLMGYGTGAIMAVPAQDDRDFEFAGEFELPIVRVIRPSDEWLAERGADADDSTGPRHMSATASRCITTRSVARRTGRSTTPSARSPSGCEQGARRATVTYKLRDWLFSRQRYWGEPFPIVYDDLGPIALPESLLPVELPEMTNFEPATSDDPDALPEPPFARGVRLGRGGARPSRSGVGRLRRRPAHLPPRDQHHAAVGRFVLVLPALPRPHQRGRDSSIPRSSGVGGGNARRRFAEGRSRRPLRRRGRARRVAPACTRASGTRCSSTSATCRRSSRSSGSCNQGMILAAAYTDERGMYVEASEVVERDGGFFHDGTTGHREFGKIGKSLKNVGDARRHLRRVRRRHVAALRDVHGPARRVASVEHRRHHRRAPLPAAVVAQRDRRGDRRGARHRRAPRRRDAARAAPHDRGGARRHASMGFNTAIARLDRVQQPAHGVVARDGAAPRAVGGAAAC